MKKLSVTLLLSIMTACTVPNHFPSESFKGKVVDSETEKPLEGALVFINSTSTAFFAIHNHLIGYAYTDEDGNYEISSESQLRLVASTDPSPVKGIIVVQKNYQHHSNVIYDKKGAYTRNIYLRKCQSHESCSEKPRGHFTDKALKLMEDQLEN